MGFGTVEVGNELPQHDLPTKLPAAALPITQALPKARFHRRHRAAKLSRAFDQLRMDSQALHGFYPHPRPLSLYRSFLARERGDRAEASTLVRPSERSEESLSSPFVTFRLTNNGGRECLAPFSLASLRAVKGRTVCPESFRNRQTVQ